MIFSESELRFLENTSIIKNYGRLFNADKQHKIITGIVHEVSERIGITHPPVILHKGRIDGIFYYRGNALNDKDCLILPDSIESFPLDEIRALIAHELDHKVRRNLSARLDQISKSFFQKNTSQYSSDYFHISMKRIFQYLELSADKRAATLYGADNLENALVRVAHFAGYPEIAKLMRQAAAGIAKTGDANMDQRLRKIGGMQKGWRERIETRQNNSGIEIK